MIVTTNRRTYKYQEDTHLPLVLNLILIDHEIIQHNLDRAHEKENKKPIYVELSNGDKEDLDKFIWKQKKRTIDGS